MNLEIRLGIEFEIAGFAKTATLDELAVYLLGLKNKIVEDAS